MGHNFLAHSRSTQVGLKARFLSMSPLRLMQCNLRSVMLTFLVTPQATTMLQCFHPQLSFCPSGGGGQQGAARVCKKYLDHQSIFLVRTSVHSFATLGNPSGTTQPSTQFLMQLSATRILVVLQHCLDREAATQTCTQHSEALKQERATYLRHFFRVSFEEMQQIDN